MLKKQIIPIVRAFQSALPRGERRTRSYNPTACKRFQSALPRGERRGCTIVSGNQLLISIRAPTRGATESARYVILQCWNFNPRSREGSDVSVQIVILQLKISIRAPARGATTAAGTTIPSTVFQSALPRGERPWTHCHCVTGAGFQSALPRGERQTDSTIVSSDSEFQSALPRGERRFRPVYR